MPVPRWSLLEGIALLAGMVLLAGPHPLQAQAVTGRVVDARNGAEIERAVISAFDVDDERVGGAVSGEGGRFLVTLDPGGPYRFTVEALSYDSATVSSIHVEAFRTDDVGEIRLVPAPLALDTLLGEGTRRPRGRDRVQRRQMLGTGTFLAGAIIEHDNPQSLTHYLGDAAGLPVRYIGVSGHRARAADFTRSRTPSVLQNRIPRAITSTPRLSSPRAPRNCMTITINHWPIQSSGHRSLDDIPLSSIAAVEIYETPREVPEEAIFGIDHHWQGCGVLNVWLRGSW